MLVYTDQFIWSIFFNPSLISLVSTRAIAWLFTIYRIALIQAPLEGIERNALLEVGCCSSLSLINTPSNPNCSEISKSTAFCAGENP